MQKLRFVNDIGYAIFQGDRLGVAAILSRPLQAIDEAGYDVQLIAAASYPKKGWLAWVDYYHKEVAKNHVDCNYYLRAQIDEQIAVDWTIETHNPYFGCHVVYLAWHDETLVFIYREKHSCYGASVGQDKELIRITLGRHGIELCVRDNEVFTYTPNILKRYKLPNWEELETPSMFTGIELGILEEVI